MITSALALILMFASCGEKAKNDDGKVDIAGKVEQVGEGMISLEKMGDSGWEIVAETKPDDKGNFSFEIEITQPDFYRLNFFGRQRNLVVLDDEDITIEAAGTGPGGKFDASGSVEMDQLQKYDSLNNLFSEKVMEVNQIFNEARVGQNTEKMDSLRLVFQQYEKDFQASLKSDLMQEEPTLAIFQVTASIPVDSDLSFHQEMLQKFQENFGDNKYLREYATMVENESKLAIGAQAPEIALPNPEGDTIRLSDLRGKIVMIDFWAAWCKPCRMENPNVVRVYNKYKNKGFDVLGVSLDRSRDAWLKAIEADGLVWHQVSDLQYFNSVAAQKYNVQGIPFTVLIDEDGKIIAKNLRGKALEQKLAEVIG